MDEQRSQPKVSVVMPVYNHESFVWSACLSVLEQDYPNLQLIALDDGSTDDSAFLLAQLAKDWPGSRFRWLSTANQGAHAALNAGTAMADGELVMFINSDDYFAAGRVEAAVRSLSGTRNLRDAWGFSAVSFIDSAGENVDPGDHGLSVYRDYMYHVSMGAWAAELLPWHNVVLTSGNLIVGRDLLARVGQFADLRLTHDWDMALRLLAVSDPIIIPESLYLYRLHGTNTFRGLSQDVATSESKRVHRNWTDAVSMAPAGSSAGLPFVARLRARRGLRSSWDGA